MRSLAGSLLFVLLIVAMLLLQDRGVAGWKSCFKNGHFYDIDLVNGNYTTKKAAAQSSILTPLDMVRGITPLF